MSNLWEGKLVRLRAVEPDDWKIFHEWDKDGMAGRFTDEVWFPGSTVVQQKWAEDEATRKPDNDEYRFQIESLAGELVGTLNTHSCNPRNGTFYYGIAILPPHQRKGYASDAIKLLLRYYFHERRYQKVNATVYSFNEPSMRLHQRLGFQQEGCLRNMIYTDGQFHDELIFGLTVNEFNNRYGKA
jgi:RimJ/RimL family protein N-acetyltransferase